MPNSVLWVCLVAVWLFVLVPMVIKGRPQILKSTDAARKTRLLHRGGSRASTATRDRRRSSARHPHDPSWKSSRRTATTTFDEDKAEDGTADTEVSEDTAESTTTRVRRADKSEVEKPTVASADLDADDDDDEQDEHTELSAVDIDADDEASDSDLEASEDIEDAEYDDDFVDIEDEVEDDAAEYEDEAELEDEAEFEDATDELDEDEYDDYARGSRSSEAHAEDGEPESDIDEVEDSPVARSRTERSGRRSVYSSEKERELKYRERQRVTLGLFALTLLAVVSGFLIGMPGWVATGVLGLLLVGYLAYLRRAVMTEQQIRAQRLARAKRAARAEQERRRRAAAVPEFAAAPPPPRLRRPGGATVLEIDDEDPVFDHLPPFQRRRVEREDHQYRRVG